jgi:hypothetical protein
MLIELTHELHDAAKMLNPVALLRSASSRSSSSRFLLAPSSSIEDLYDNETNSCYSEESCSSLSGSHHSTLDRLYTWEKKLYKEVKVRFLPETNTIR